MFSRAIVLSYVAASIAAVLASPASAAVGDAPFSPHAYVIRGSFSCNGGPATSLGNVDEASVAMSGDSVVDGHNQALSACPGLGHPSGVPIYSIGDVHDEAIATYTTVADSAEAISNSTKVSLLGDLVTYTSKLEDDTCSETDAIECTGNTSIEGLTFAGQPITGTFTEPTVFTTAGAYIPARNCGGLGVALFTGNLTLNDAVNSTTDHAVSFVPIALKGKLTCLGTGLAVVDVDLKDATSIEYGVIAAGIGVVLINVVNATGHKLP